MNYSFMHNATLLVAIVFVIGRAREFYLKIEKNNLFFNIVVPILGGLASVLVMFETFEYQNMYFDLRQVPVFLIAYILGTERGILAGIIPITFRLFLGGPGMTAGILIGIVLPIVIGGVVGKRYRSKYKTVGFNARHLTTTFLLQELIRLPLLLWVVDVPLVICMYITLFSTMAVVGMGLILADGEHKAQAIISLRESEERYRYLVEVSPQPIIIHRQGRIVFANPAALDLVQVEALEEVQGKAVWDFLEPSSYPTALSRLDKLTRGVRLDSTEYKLKLANGQTKIIEVTAVGIHYMNEPAIFTVAKDISVRKKLEQQISHMAYHDKLTGLPNRYLLAEYFKRAVNRAERRAQTLSVLFIDLDRFKLINDTLGHSTGDQVLQEAAKRLKNCVRASDVVFRHGGDEFLILLEEVTKEEVSQIAQRILEKFADPFAIAGQKCFSSPSIGISMYPTDGEDVDTLIRNADLAMYYAKEQGKNNYQYYTYNAEISRKLQIELEIRTALAANQFSLHYQPQVDLKTKQIVGMEALLRWEHPELGMISPGEFIPIAEETGSIIDIGNWVIKTACEQNVAWQRKGYLAFPVMVNVSLRQIQHSTFIDAVRNILNATGLEPQFLELELSESMMQYKEEIIGILKALKNLGVKVTIDNFGTGYSILNLLKHVNFDHLKIDPSFVADIVSDANAATLVKALVSLGRELDFAVVAGGIEELEQAEFLRELQCAVGQGYYFTRPLSGSAIDTILSEE